MLTPLIYLHHAEQQTSHILTKRGFGANLGIGHLLDPLDANLGIGHLLDPLDANLDMSAIDEYGAFLQRYF